MKLITDQAIQTEIITEQTIEGTKKLYISGPFLMHTKENRNNRIYSKKGMDAAVKRYTEDYIKTCRSLGEMNHPCFDASANVFVESKGLIPITDVEIGDYVIGVDPDTNVASRTKVLNVTKNKFQGDLLRFTSRSFKATVTPYHRFYIKDRKGAFQVVTADQIYNDFKFGTRKLSHSYIPLSIENWKGDFDDSIIFTPRYVRQLKEDYHSIPLELSYTDFCAFMGIYLSEGNLTYYTRSSGEKIPSNILISQNVGSRLDEIIALIERMGINRYTVQYPKEGDVATISICDIRLADYLEKFGDCYSKYVPDEILSSTKENIAVFLYWYHIGDGTDSIHGEYSQASVFTVSEKLANGLIECILKAGHSTTKRTQISSKEYTFADHVIRPESKVPLYRMTIGRSIGKYVDDRFLSIEEVPYDDYVYCLTTETGNFYVEQHNTCFLTGNCGRLQVDPERACILTTELTPDGNYYHGKAKVLSTPLGKVLEALLNDGVRVGVSSRGVGSVTKRGNVTMVGEDFSLTAAADCVWDPSVGDAFVNHLMEEKEYLLIDGHYIEKDLFEAKANIKKTSRVNLEEAKLKAFQDFLNKIKS